MTSRSNLIVNYVANDITDASFKAMFAAFGNMTNCKLIKDKITGLSVGYGFVKYDADASAQAAIDALNGYQCGNKRMKVSVARPEGSVQQVERADLFVGGMPKTHTEADIQAMFSPYGMVEEVKVFTDNITGQSKGSAFVRMDSQANAKAVIDGLNGQQQANGITLVVKEFTSRSRQDAAPNQAYGGQAYGAPAPSPYGQAYGAPQAYGYGAYGQQAQAGGYASPAGAYSQYGSAAPAYGQQQPTGPYSPQGYPDMSAGYGAGYAAYGQQTDPVGYGAMRPAAAVAQSRFNPMGGKPQGSKPMNTGPVDPSSVTLFVFHLPTDISEDGIRQMFESYGTVTETTVVRSKEDNTSRGFGFVSFTTHQEAVGAMDAMNGYQIGTKYLKVSFKK